MRKSKTTDTNPFLVCGLGNLGQYCVSVLKEFGVVVNAIDDRLVVLATIEGLQRIEKGIITPREWIVQLDKVIREEGFIRGALIVFRVCGVSMQVAEKLMHQLPDALPCLFYKHQAQRLINELSEVHVLAHVEKRTVNY